MKDVFFEFVKTLVPENVMLALATWGGGSAVKGLSAVAEKSFVLFDLWLSRPVGVFCELVEHFLSPSPEKDK